MATKPLLPTDLERGRRCLINGQPVTFEGWDLNSMAVFTPNDGGDLIRVGGLGLMALHATGRLAAVPEDRS